MAKCAVMCGDVVVNIVVVDNKEESEKALKCVLIEYTNENPAGIGWVFDTKTNVFYPPTLNEKQDRYTE